MRLLLLVSLIIPFSFSSGYSQGVLSLEFLKDTTPVGRKYISLIFHADSLYKAHDFQKAVATYDEAYLLKPKQQYPRFKAEDIRTLYLKNDITKTEQKQGVPTEYAWSKRHREKTEKEERKKLIAEGKTVPELRKEKQNPVTHEKSEKKEPVKVEEKQEQKKDTVTIVKKEDEIKKFVPQPVDEKTKKEAEEKLKTYEDLKAKEAAEEKQKEEKQELAKKEMNVNVKTDKKEVPLKKEITTISDIIVQKSREEEQKRINANVSMEQEMKPEDEQKLLAAKYPKEKTVETIKEATKTTTQVIINQGGIVTIYLRVAHNWGQTFYFVKEPSSQMKSISRDYFERFTR